MIYAIKNSNILKHWQHIKINTINDGAGEPDLYAPIAALTINSTGNNNAHNNMQPFIVFNYLIKY